METETPTPTATPYVWATPTAWAYSGATPEFDFDVNESMVTFAENTVQGWNTFNQDGVLDDFLTLVIIIILFLIIRRIITSLRTVHNA
jgi:hypothetical protein